MAIPKVIHYCWFGGNSMPESVRQYINGWKAVCPDYELHGELEEILSGLGNKGVE